jgi:tetratricopeptide (TPR) repeat protein
MSESLGNTQPLKPVKRSARWRSILISAVGVLVLLGLAGLGGYQNAIGIRQDAKSQVITQQLAQQFQLALVDEQFKHWDSAKQRLDFIIQTDPSFPGAQTEITKVLIALSIPTATTTPTLTPTPDVRSQQALFSTAQQLIATGDWANGLTELDQLRKDDPKFNTAQVDGMYYYALRNYGVDLIQKQGNLEGGVYELDLAARFGPLDRDAQALSDGAKLYIDAASYYGLNWQTAATELEQVYNAYPAMWDGTQTAAQRYQYAAMRYGDQLVSQNRFCEAVKEYQAAQGIGGLDVTAQKGFNQAYNKCYPPTAVPTLGVPTP